MIQFRRSVGFAIALCSIQAGCGGQQTEPSSADSISAPTSPAETPSTPAPTASELLAKWYGDCWELFNTKKWDEFSKCYAEDATATLGSMPTVLTGRSQIIEQHAKRFADAFPDVRGERQLTLVNGNQIVSLALMHGTHTGPLLSPDGSTIPATGKPIGLLMMHTVEVNSAGQVVKQWEVSNSPTMLAQLGLSPEPARPLMLEGQPETLVFAQNDATEAKNVEAYKKGYELFSKHDAALFELFADGIVFKDPTVPADVVGKDENIAMTQSFWKAFSDIKGELDVVWGAGDYTVGFGRLTGTNDGDLPAMGLKKTGKKVTVRFGEIAKWENGKVTEMYPFMNGMDWAAQLGMLDKPAPKKVAPGKAAKPTDK